MDKQLVTTARGAVVVGLTPAPNRTNLTLREVAEAHLAGYRGRDPGRHSAVGFWTDALGGCRVADITADDIADVLDRYANEPMTKFVGKDPATGAPIYREFGKRAPATVNRCRSVISGLLTFAQRRRFVPRGWTNPCREVPPEEFNNQRTRFLSSDERDRLLATVRVSAYPRLYLLTLMAITTGARKGELLALTYADLDLPARTAHVRTSKNGEQRILPLTDAVAAEIKRFGKAKPEALLFGSVKRPGRPMQVDSAFCRAVREARIEDFRFHDLRHSCASYLAQNGATLLEIADVLGHKTLDMVRRYSHLTVGHKAALVGRVLGGIR